MGSAKLPGSVLILPFRPDRPASTLCKVEQAALLSEQPWNGRHCSSPPRLGSPKDTVSGRGVLLPALCRMCSPGSNYRCSGKHSVVGVNADFQIPFKELQVALESVRHHTGQDPTALQLLQESNKRAGTEGLTEQNWGDANQPGLLLLRCAEM